MAVGERLRVEDPAPTPGNVDVRPWCPQPAVLRLASAFVSQAGMGSAMEAPYLRVPLVCVPQITFSSVEGERARTRALSRKR